MTTITGKILNTSDSPLYALVKIVPNSVTFPYVASGGMVLTSSAVQFYPSASDGSFSVNLEAGYYTFQVLANNVLIASFLISVPNTGGTVTLDQIVTNNLTPVNNGLSGSGSPEGVVTAIPGTPYTDTTGMAFWFKITGTGNTGWQKVIQL